MMHIIQKMLKKSLVFTFVLFSFFQISFIQLVHAQPPKTLTSPTGIAYMSGGIGKDQVLEMRPYAKKFTLNLLFSEGLSGRSATNINVNIYNEQDQRVFRIVGSNPLLYVNLPAGNYLILASNNGQKLRHKLTIEANTNTKVILNWKDLGEDQIREEDMQTISETD